MPASGTAKGPLLWSPRMGVGNRRLDDDHKLLIDLVNQLSRPEAETRRDGLGADQLVESILHTLIDYAAFHFAREEAALAAVGYPDLDSHRADHQALADQVRDYLAGFERDPDSLSLADLAAFVRHWLLAHILREDKAFEAYLTGHPEADAAIDGVPLLGGLSAADLADPLEVASAG